LFIGVLEAGIVPIEVAIIIPPDTDPTALDGFDSGGEDGWLEFAGKVEGKEARESGRVPEEGAARVILIYTHVPHYAQSTPQAQLFFPVKFRWRFSGMELK
jgi:hypothetical protein